MRLLKDSKVWIIIKTFRSCKKFYNQAFSNTFLIRKLQWALVLGQLTFVYSEQVLLAFRLRAGSVILLILANNDDPAQLFEKKGIHHYLRAPSQDSGDGSVHVFDFLLWYEEYFTTWRQAKTKHVTAPEAIIFFIVEMPGILHSAKGLLSQRAECSSCICPDIASWRWSDSGFPHSAAAEVVNAVPNTSLHLVVM